MDAAGLTMDPETCPDCAKALAHELEGFTEGNETPGDSDSDCVYELSQDHHHRDRRDSRQPRKKSRRLGKTAAKVVHFWRLVCDTFRKIVDSKYFGRGIMIAILINTLSMGIEYHEQVSARFFSSLSYENFFFNGSTERTLDIVAIFREIGRIPTIVYTRLSLLYCRDLVPISIGVWVRGVQMLQEKYS